MHRRNSSKRLSRRKSTSSTCSKHESIDPEIARQHAQTAATLAFTRAQERTSTDGGHRGKRHSRSNTTSSHIDRQSLPPQPNDNDVSHPNMGVRRQQSVRFVGPNAIQRPQSNIPKIAQAMHAAIERKQSTADLGPIAMTTNTPVPAAYRPPSRSSSLGKASIGRGKAESFVTAVAAYNELYTREDELASTPSSYRRIRKSKSMFSPLKAPSVFYTNGTPDRSGGSYISTNDNTPNYQISQSKSHEAPLRVQRSMSFLRGGRGHVTRERNDQAVQMARDRFFQQTTQQRLREQPSFLFRSKAQRQDKPFRKSVRTASTSNHSTTVNSFDHPGPFKERRLRDKARKASRTIKDKLKRVFGRNRDPVDIPRQQVDAHETHVRKYCGDVELMHNDYENVPHPTQATLSRVAARPPSLHEFNSSQQLRSFAGSVKSAQSDHSCEKSRVTSWDTSGVNTLTSQAARLQAERELQRLSIINENGTHVPSSSFARPKLNQTSAYPFHHRPSKSAGHIPPHIPGPVDSARVYSALMKRLDESSPRAKLEASRKASTESFNPGMIVQQRSSSLSSRGDKTPVTIRHVLPDDPSNKAHEEALHEHQWVRSGSVHTAHTENASRFTGTHIHQWTSADTLRDARMRQEDDVFSPSDAPFRTRTSDTNISKHRRIHSDTSLYPLSRQVSMKALYYTVPEELGLTPQDIALRNEPVIPWQQPLRESRSTFFGGSSITIARTTSPFRRSQVGHNHNSSTTSIDDQSLPNPIFQATTSTELMCPLIEVQDTRKAYSDSMYSRTTSGQGPAAADSTSSLPMDGKDSSDLPPPVTAPGDVIIIDRRTYRPGISADQGHRNASSGGSTGSTEWKNWMSSEVAKLERGKENANMPASYVNYALPTMPKSFQAGHIRESAQIAEDYSDISQKTFNAAKQPLGVLQYNSNVQNIPQYNTQNVPHLKPILKKRSTISLVENNDLSAPVGSIPVPPPPPVPVRSPLRQKHSRSSLPSTTNGSSPHSETLTTVKVPSVNGRNMLHKRTGSASTIKSTKSVETPGKLVKKSKRSSGTTAQENLGSRHSASSGKATGEKQFGSASTRSRTPGSTWIIDSEANSPERNEDIYCTDGAGLMGPAMTGGMDELNAQQMGSKRMVDMFLSSRRKRIAGGSDESGVFI